MTASNACRAAILAAVLAAMAPAEALARYRTDTDIEEYERGPPIWETAFAPDALIVVGTISLLISAFVVLSHLCNTFFGREGDNVFRTDSPPLLAFFYTVIVIFLGVIIF